MPDVAPHEESSERPRRSGRGLAITSCVFFFLGLAALLPVPSCLGGGGGSGWSGMIAAGIGILLLWATGLCWLLSVILGLVVVQRQRYVLWWIGAITVVLLGLGLFAGLQDAARERRLSLPATPADPQAPFAGSWTAEFTFERNTKSDEPRHPWFTFQWDVAQAGDAVTGTMASPSVTGTLSGVVGPEGFQGVMRLGWDTHDWKSLRFTMSRDLNGGSGEAVFQASPEEQHRYSIRLKRN
ncbi:MAG: hypothetical protein JXB04_03675 [Kiritimatiellae bacterium]|nr:hypothetical protein [Kiritimatiellia bacterium]